MKILLLMVLISIAGRAVAEEHDCFDQPTNFEVDRCFSRDLARADEQLSAAIANAMAKFLPKERLTFTRSHDAWKNYRDLHCDFVGSMFEGGRMKPLIE